MLAYSRRHEDADPARVETILGRQLTQHLRALFEERGVFTHLATSDEPLFVAADADHRRDRQDGRGRTGGRELLGSVWVECPAPLGRDARTALADGARTVALHVLRSRASADLERQVESELVIRRLEGTVEAATVTSRLGLPQASLRVIALHAHIGGERHAGLLPAFERATTGFGWSRPGRSALAGDRLHVAARVRLRVRTTLGERAAGRAVRRDDAAGRQQRSCQRRRTGGGPPGGRGVSGPARAGTGQVPPVYDEAWDDILLQRLRAAARAGRAPTRGPVAELRRHDRAHDTPYVATLEAWLAAQGELAVAGARLGVHENTVLYRLRKMSEVTVLGLDDARTRLAMMIEQAATDDP